VRRWPLLILALASCAPVPRVPDHLPEPRQTWARAAWVYDNRARVREGEALLSRVVSVQILARPGMHSICPEPLGNCTVFHGGGEYTVFWNAMLGEDALCHELLHILLDQAGTMERSEHHAWMLEHNAYYCDETISWYLAKEKSHDR